MNKIPFFVNPIENRKELFMIINESDFPIGFTMALALDANAMKVFSNLDEDAKQKVIDESRKVTSKKEMLTYVSSLGKGEHFS